MDSITVLVLFKQTDLGLMSDTLRLYRKSLQSPLMSTSNLSSA